jgi:6-phosphogluconolactonase
MALQMYVSLQGDNRIVRFLMDPDTGSLEPHGAVEVSGGPAPMTFNPDRTALYVGRRDGLILSSYAIDQSTGDLTPTGDVALEGEPCYLSTDHTGRSVLSAYYQAGYCAVHPIDAAGAVGGAATEWLETGSGAHCFMTDPSNQYAYLPHIANGSGGLALLPEGRQEGLNTIYQFRFDAATGRLTPNEPLEISPDDLDGPRHYRFHPNKDLMYVSNEQGGSVTVYAVDSAKGTLTARQTISTLPADFTGQRLCSQIQMHPAGTHLYVGNRGHNSIASFAIDAATGALTATGWAAVDPIPRAFSLDPSGNFLYVTGLETGNIISFRVDQNSGALTRLETHAVGSLPMWVLITELPG